MMIKRLLKDKIKETLNRSASVALLGPRQVGKTTLALHVAENTKSTYLDLENSLDILKVKDIGTFHEENSDKLIILDEVQRLPKIFLHLRGIIDKERRKGNKTGQFLFLGSASIDLIQQSGESLAGRISYLELFPINIMEYGNKDIDKINRLWIRGGFPESLLSRTDNDSLAWRQDFIKTYLERDIPQLGPRIPAQTLERFWTMLAYKQGTTLNASQLARSLDVSSVTIGRYLDLMVDLLLVRRLPPYLFNIGKRLVKTPKVYVRDSGIVNALLNIADYNNLLSHPVVGGSWEGFVIENILSVAPRTARPYFYRTSSGAEIDLVLEFGLEERWAIEIKRSSVPKLSKGFYIACDDIKATKKFVVYAGQDIFKINPNVTAISLRGLMERLMDS